MAFDIEVYRISDGTTTSWEFRPTSSKGQDWIEEDLGLKGSGQNAIKLVVNDHEGACGTAQAMRDDGLEVGGLP